MGLGSLNPFRSSSPLNPGKIVSGIAGAAEDVVKSVGNELSNLEDSVKTALQNPIVQVALAYYAPGFGEMIAADLGVSQAVGTAIAKVGIQTASGVPLETAILNAGVDAGVSAGVKDISPEVRKAFTDNPGLADAVTSAGASAVSTAAKGGSGDDTLKAAVAGAAGSSVTTATGDKVLGAAATGYATGGVQGAATAASGALGTEAAAADKAKTTTPGVKVAGPLDITGFTLTAGQDAYLKSPLPAGYALASTQQADAGKAVNVELPSGQSAWVIQTSPDAKPLPAAAVEVKQVANFPQVGIDFSTTDQNVASNLSAILKVNQGSQGQALGGTGSYGLTNVPVSFVGRYGDQSVFETSGGDRFSLINVGDRTGVQDKFGNVVWVDPKVSAELSNVATVATEMAKTTDKPIPTTPTTEQIYQESASDVTAGGGGGGTDSVVVSDKKPAGTSTTAAGGVTTGDVGKTSTAGASGVTGTTAGAAGSPTSGAARYSDADIKNYVLANINNPADIAAAASRAGVSVDDLSRAVGVSVDAVNKYFGDAGIAAPGGTGGGGGAGGTDTSGSTGTGGGTGGGTGTGDGTGEGEGSGEGSGGGDGGFMGGGFGGGPSKTKKKDETNITVTSYKSPPQPAAAPATITSLGAGPLQQALTAYRPAGEIEDVSTGKKRENVWNESSLRLKDALGI